MTNKFVIVAFLLNYLYGKLDATTRTVSIFNRDMNQLVTSNTLKWESYVPKDETSLQYAVVGSHTHGEVQHPVYICRAPFNNGIFISGSTKRIPNSNQYLCEISMHSEVVAKKHFDLLLNKENGAKIAWQKWDKYSGGLPKGAVSSAKGESQGEELYYVARKNITTEHNHTRSLLARHAPWDGLGKIFFVEDGHESVVENGELLIETEPVKYELRQIVYDKFRTQVKRNKTLLGQTVLMNEDDKENNVEAVITYMFDRISYFGVNDGVARGISVQVFETIEPAELLWGIVKTDKVIETKTVSTRLMPGTALNVTMWGNYTSSEGPYKASLRSYYADNSDPTMRHIDVNTALREEMMDVKIEYSPVYWLHNHTLVPTTTTQRTTSTTFQSSTTKDKVVISSSSLNPLSKSEKASTEKVQSSSSSSFLSLCLSHVFIIVVSICVINY